MSTPEIRYGRPSLGASRFVQFYVQRKGCSGVRTLTMPVMARSCALLDFELGDMFQISSRSTGFGRLVEPAALVGPETCVQHRLSVQGAFEHFQIHFHTTALKHLFRLSAPELTDRNYAANDILGAWVSELRQQLGEARSFEHRTRLADAFIAELSPCTPIADPIALSAAEILRSQGSCRIDQLVHQIGFSMRNFQRRFIEDTGISPKLYARIVRFESVLKWKAASPKMTWMNAAHQVGYHDQMHMVHDFREFAADTPTSILRHLEQWSVPPADFEKTGFA